MAETPGSSDHGEGLPPPPQKLQFGLLFHLSLLVICLHSPARLFANIIIISKTKRKMKHLLLPHLSLPAFPTHLYHHHHHFSGLHAVMVINVCVYYLSSIICTFWVPERKKEKGEGGSPRIRLLFLHSSGPFPTPMV